MDQLIGASLPTSAGSKNYVYGYDKAGNRTQEQIDASVTTSTHNNLNQLTGQSPGGLMEFAGTVSEPSTVTLADQPASVDGANNWKGRATVTTGANAILLVATDASGNTTTKTIEVTATGGASRTLVYDLNGNLTNDGAGKAFGWDAANRLVKIVQGADVTEFVYNGYGQRVAEKFNGTEIKRWIWCGGVQPCEERDANNAVTKRFAGGLGEQTFNPQLSTFNSYFYTTDHLGSVREMTDSAGVVRARYGYDPYGRLTKISGDLEADFGFTGHYRHQASGLNLTLFRAYDPELGRWLSRDSLGELGPDGPNVYGYVLNDPVNGVDPTGLAYEITPTQGLHYNDRNSKFGFRVIGDGRGRITTAPLGGKHTYNAQRAQSILNRDLANGALGKTQRDWIVKRLINNPTQTKITCEKLAVASVGPCRIWRYSA